jgi:hypothetical protein
MMNLAYTTLYLRSPLYYVPGAVPFQYREGEETVMAFELNRETAEAIDVDPACYLGTPLWTGKAGPESEAAFSGVQGPGPLPYCIDRGAYFFSQIRELPGKAGWTALAIEVQKEGLWRRNRLGRRLYLRCVYEDGGPAAQVFREIKLPAALR